MTDEYEVDHLDPANLRDLLNKWNPLGVPDFINDEYDCLLAPLWQRLTNGITRASLAEFLWHEIQDHFGLDPERCGTDQFADELLAFAAT